MSKFRFKTADDIALLTEVESLNPFAFKRQKEIWIEICEKLTKAHPSMTVSHRSCCERTKLLLKQFEEDECESRKSSGITEDEMGMLKHMLTSVQKLQKDKSKYTKKLYTKSNRDEAEKIRNSVLEKMDNVSDTDENEETDIPLHKSNDGEDEDECPNILPVPIKKKKCASKNEAVVYLAQKLEVESNLKIEEIKVRMLEAQNKKAEIEMQKGKMEDQMKLEQEKLTLEREKLQMESAFRERQIQLQSEEKNQLLTMLSNILKK